MNTDAITTDRISADDSEAAALAADVGSKLSEYSRLRRRRERLRRFRRGAIGLAVVLCMWQFMAVAYNLEQILPPPLAVGKTIVNALMLHYAHPWTYGPNIYEHLIASFTRAISGFAIAALFAIPLGLLVGRIGAVREYVDLIIRSLYPIPGIAWIPLAILWFGLGNTAVMIVAGEMLASQTGIGSVLMESRFQFRADDLMMAMVLISIVGFATEKLIVGTLEKKTVQKWEVKIL
jgi:ABC-type nitrate/sulfonate/bicarbonate transport system permease component